MVSRCFMIKTLFVRRSTAFSHFSISLGNVAQDLREWLEAAGYEVNVVGGGRINYRISSDGQRHATIYGFSYGFGRGDHKKAAEIIQQWSQNNVATSVNESSSLY
jgi:Janus/Ocnus family (Ocnus)